MVIEYISKGTIINAHNFLAERPAITKLKCLTSVTYYYLSLKQLEDVTRAYKALRQEVRVASEEAYYKKMLSMDPLDYQETKFVFR